MATAHADDWRLFFGPVLDCPQDELDVWVVLDGVVEFSQRVVQALVGAGIFDSAKQLGIPNPFSIGIGLHGSKRKLALPREAAWKLVLWAKAAHGGLNGEEDFGDHFAERLPRPVRHPLGD